MIHRYLIPALAVFCLQLWFTGAGHAQVISVKSNDQDIEAMTVEAEVKRLLRAEGYEVRGGTSDGYIVSILVMPVGGGFVGSVLVTSEDWDKLADGLVSTPACTKEHVLARQVRGVVGTQELIVAARMFRARTEQELAVVIAERVNKAVRQGNQRIEAFWDGLKKGGSKVEQNKIDASLGEQVH